MKTEKKNNTAKLSREEYLYHNTELLLKKYRKVVLSIEISTIQANINFEREFECKLEDFLDMSYAAGADLSGTNIQDHMRILERNKNMLKIVETALEILKNRHIKGVKYYWILFYTYLSEKPCESTEAIIDCVNDKLDDYICWTSYFRLRKKAIETLGDILWGFTSKECLPVLNEFSHI